MRDWFWVVFGVDSCLLAKLGEKYLGMGDGGMEGCLPRLPTYYLLGRAALLKLMKYPLCLLNYQLVRYALFCGYIPSYEFKLCMGVIFLRA
jgi:hypothetical protein